MNWAGDPYFTKEEMCCKGFAKGLCQCGGILPTDLFMYDLVEIRREYGLPMVVTSGARCPIYNAKVSTSGADGPHTRRVAADIRVFGSNAMRLLAIALRHGVTGVGVDQRPGIKAHERFLHLDFVPPNDPEIFRPTIWSYI